MIVILGGTAESRALAAALTAQDVAVLSTLAGRVSRPRLPAGEVRIGGFGGVDGLVDYLTSRRVRAVVDATHPFAAGISANAVAASSRTGIPLLRLARPGWSSRPGADGWLWVDSHREAALAAAGFHRPLLTIGRQSLGEFTGPLAGLPVAARVVDEPDIALPNRWLLLRDRGPYEAAGEAALLARLNSDVLVTKDSGGTYTWPKMDAAMARGTTIVIVRRPAVAAGCATASDVDGTLEWLAAQGVYAS